ncbi:MAG: ABC transporter substrate-binding protein, partial [Pseudomonadota bacterium]
RICAPSMAACPDGGGQPEYDPDKARALLAEAGLADGFDVTITTVTHVSKAAEAIAGYLRDVGIRASVDSKTMGGYRKAQGAGKINILVQAYGHGGMPDAGNALAFYYASKARDYAKDDELKAVISEANATIDLAPRTELNRKAYDMITERSYIMPIGTNPFVFVHTNDVVLDTSDKAAMMTPYGISAQMFGWAK